MEKLIAASVIWMFSFLAFVISLRSAREKGFLLNNAYLFASRKVRETMDKKPYYRQTAVTFFLIGIIAFLEGLSLLPDAGWISYIAITVAVTTVLYAIVSSIAIEKRKQQKY